MDRVSKRILRGESAFVAAAALTLVPGCGADGPRDCTLIGCDNGLVIDWKGHFESGTEYHLDLYEITPTEAVPMLHCVRTSEVDAGAFLAPTTLCGSVISHHEFGLRILLDYYTATSIRIVVSANGATLGEVTASPKFTTFEPNGPGCGPTCTAAGVDVMIP